MSNRLNLPDDLSSLIEKRDSGDRRKPENASEPPPNGEERRSGEERRAESECLEAEDAEPRVR